MLLLLVWSDDGSHAPVVLGESLTQHPTTPGAAVVPTGLKGVTLLFCVLRWCLLNGFRCKALRQIKRRQT